MAHADHTPDLGQPNGIATLGPDGKLLAAQMPAGAGSGDVVGPPASVVDAVAQFADTSGKLLKTGPRPGVAGGLATLDANGTLPLAQLPAHSPAGAAGGDLGDTYPNPTVRQASKAFALNGVLSPAAFGTDQHDYAPAGLAEATVLRISTLADASITGIAGGTAGRLLAVHNVGAFKLSLVRESGSSAAANRFAISSDALLLPDTAVLLQYDAVSSRWRLAGAGASAPTLLPAPRFFRVTTDMTTTQEPPGWATLLSGSFTLAASELSLILLLTVNVSTDKKDKVVEVRLVLNGVSLGGTGGSVRGDDLPISGSLLAQATGVVGVNTFDVQWRVSDKTAQCRPVSFPDTESAALAVWSSA